MKYHKIFFIAYCIIYSNFVTAQYKTERMYLLMANSTDHVYHWPGQELNPITSDTTKPTVLYMLDRGSLKSIDTINFNHQMGSIMPECRHFEEFKYFFIRENGLKGSWISDNSGNYYDIYNEGSYVSILDYSGDTIELRKANADSISKGCELRSGKVYTKNGQMFISFSKCENQIPYNRNIIDKYLEIEELSEQTFIFADYGRAESSLFDRMGSNAGAPFDKDGKLYKRFIQDVGTKNNLDFQFPYKVDSKKYSNINFLIRTPSCNKEVLFKRLYGGATDSITAYYIYDKNTTHLDSITTHFKILGMNLYQDRIGYGTLALNPKYSKNKSDDMPSVKRYSDKYGYIPNLQYNTGKFFIWDLERNEFTIFSFDDLDTELLSIHDDWVYFRVFDEIRRIRLDDLYLTGYQKNTELLYKDKDRVPHIHHVFWAPEMPLKVEWKTGNPYTKTSEK